MIAIVKEWGFPALMVALVAGALIFLATTTYRSTDFGPRIAGAFYAGQMVSMEAFGHSGMVVRVRCPFQKLGSVCRYDVRFPAMQLHTDTRLFGADGPVQFAPVALVRGIYEFELRRVP